MFVLHAVTRLVCHSLTLSAGCNKHANNETDEHTKTKRRTEGKFALHCTTTIPKEDENE